MCSLLSTTAFANQKNVWTAAQGKPWFYETGSKNGQPLAGSWWEGRLQPGAEYRMSFEVTRVRGVLGVHLGARSEPYRISRNGTYSYRFKVPAKGDRKMMFTALGVKRIRKGQPMLAGVRKIRLVQLSGGTPATPATTQPPVAAAQPPVETIQPPVAAAQPQPAAAPQPAPKPAPEVVPAPAPRPTVVTLPPVSEPVAPPAAPPTFLDEGQRKGHYWFFSRERNLKTELLDWLDGKNNRNDSYYTRVARDLDRALRTPGIKGFGMHIDWHTMEPRDGQFNFQLIEDNFKVARRYGLRFVIKVQDRSFDGRNIMPPYFPSQYVLKSSGMGKTGYVSKRWEPYVYNRLLRINKAIINRFGNDPLFGGLASTETAIGADNAPDYRLGDYQKALAVITNGTLAVMPDHAEYFFYMNFLRGGVNRDMKQDSRIKLLGMLDRKNMVVGGPDITPDIKGMPGSLSSARIHMLRNEPQLGQFCHMQHVDHGLGGLNKKSNKNRQTYLNWVTQITNSGFINRSGAAVYLDDIRDPSGRRVNLHPQSELGKLWKPDELFRFGQRNFKCDWMFWHYRENLRNRTGQYYWPDSQQVILNNQFFYEQN
ncbi:MAG: hypothetical protein AAGI15_00425 [Pseudomonadota bacterium]